MMLPWYPLVLYDEPSRKMQEGFMFMYVIISCPLPLQREGRKNISKFNNYNLYDNIGHIRNNCKHKISRQSDTTDRPDFLKYRLSDAVTLNFKLTVQDAQKTEVYTKYYTRSRIHPSPSNFNACWV